MLVFREATLLSTSVSFSASFASPSPRSFLTHESTPQVQLSAHRATLRTKRALSLVSHEWNALARPYLYESIWITHADQARALARTLCSEATRNVTRPWSRSPVLACTDAASHAENHECLTPYSSGYYIRHLHIATSPLALCSPFDVRTILSYTGPHLATYTDCRSLSQHRFLQEDPRCPSAALFALLAQTANIQECGSPHCDVVGRKNLRALTWTNYDEQPFHQHMSALLFPSLSSPFDACTLEYLELNSSSPAFAALGPSYSPDIPFASGPSPCIPSASSSDFSSPNLPSLPRLRTLKVALDDFTFHLFSLIALPALRALSVVSCEFNYSGRGFAAFFRAHGASLRQLELGHSSSLVESQNLNLDFGRLREGQGLIASCTPNLVEFICDASAEWHWQTPDWIPPHVLLPSHPRVEFIGIRGLDTRLQCLSEPPSSPNEHSVARIDDLNDFIASMDSGHFNANDESETFVLLEQLASLQRAAFPSLRFIRDLSPASSQLKSPSLSSGFSSSFTSLTSDASGGISSADVHIPPPPSARAMRFWHKLLKTCQEQGVWLEDWDGVNITVRGLRRASLCLE